MMKPLAYGAVLAGSLANVSYASDRATLAEPDYLSDASWMARDRAATNRRADIFYIHPTTVRGGALNQDLTDAAANQWTDISVGKRQLSAFADCCRRFAPRYRQASIAAFAATPALREEAFALAYTDVRRAFRAYIANDNRGRPFILAGHSQGALHGLRLLHEEIAGTPLTARMVVAYLPGIGIPIETIPASILPCAMPRQTRCIAGWNSFSPDADVTAYIARAHRARGSGKGALLCVNPLTFALKHPAAGFASAKGALPGPAVDGPLPRLQKRQVAAQCDGNVLRVTPSPGLAVERLPGGNLHMADIALFWADLRANAISRVNSFKQEGPYDR